jgi:3-oxoacyl-[acyl-carrier protein] reductase
VASLTKQVAVVTGSSSGIGRAIALRLARDGASVVVNYARSRDLAEAVVNEIRAAGGEGLPVRADVSRAEDVSHLLGAAIEAFGRVHAWVNNAGADILTGEGGRLSRLEKLERVLAVDLRGTIVASWAAVEAMGERGGVIINMSWDHVGQGMAGENPTLYAAAKGGIASFSRSLARSVAPRIRVNILAPGFIETAFGEQADEDWHRDVAERTPLRRWGVPEDLVGAAVYLASDESAFVTGQMIMVNGGVVM